MATGHAMLINLQIIKKLHSMTCCYDYMAVATGGGWGAAANNQSFFQNHADLYHLIRDKLQRMKILPIRSCNLFNIVN